MNTRRLILPTVVFFLVVTFGGVHLGCTPPPPPPPIAGPPPAQAPAAKETAPVEPPATLPAIGESAKAEAPPAAQKNENLEVIATYPLPEVSIDHLAILYLSEAAVCPQDKDGNEKPPVLVEPKEVRFSYKVKDNHISLYLLDETKDLPFSFIRITPDPGLKSASGKPINPATAAILVPTGKEGMLSVGSCALADT